MELRFFVGYIVGAATLAFLYHYDFEWWVVIIIGVVIYGATQSLAHKWFDN